MSHYFLFTSESVTEGHPDKMCDQISDAIVDAYLTRDPDAKTAVETAIKNNDVFLLGEISSSVMLTQQDYEKIVRDTIKSIGYEDEEHSIDYKSCKIHHFLDRQSPDIAQAVHVNKRLEDIGAGDQGLMSAYASNETRSMMPSTFQLSNNLALKLAQVRKSGELPFLRPDGKTQVTMRLYEDNRGKIYPCSIDTIILSTQHSEDISNDELRRIIFEKVIIPVVAEFEQQAVINYHQDERFDDFDYKSYWEDLSPMLKQYIMPVTQELYTQKIKPSSFLINPKTKILINPSGRFVIGGPKSDAGLTGRKIVCDAFGGWSPVGGGAYSGKDFSKVDRSASYLCRHICKSIVASGYANRCCVQLGYAIGVADPVSIYINTYNFFADGTPKGKAKIYSEDQLVDLVKANFRLRPGQIVEDQRLRRPIFGQFAAYGHFGRADVDQEQCLWERVQFF